jgi:hypothetical protein
MDRLSDLVQDSQVFASITMFNKTRHQIDIVFPHSWRGIHKAIHTDVVSIHKLPHGPNNTSLGNVAAKPVFWRTILITGAMRLFHCDSEIVTAVSGYSIVFMKDD